MSSIFMALWLMFKELVMFVPDHAEAGSDTKNGTISREKTRGDMTMSIRAIEQLLFEFKTDNHEQPSGGNGR